MKNLENIVTLIKPSGNVTAIIEGFQNSTLYSAYGKNVLSFSESIAHRVEQVGFSESPLISNSDGRVFMAGSEFCVNAVRSLAALLGSKTNYKKSSFKLEVSGYTDNICNPIQLQSTVTKINHSLYDVSLDLNLDILLSRITTVNLDLAGQEVLAQQVDLSGITHFFFPFETLPLFGQDIFDKSNSGKSNFDFPKLKTFFKYLLSSNLNLKNFCAFGMVAYKKIELNRYAIYPIVYVAAQDSIFYETSCGSATLGIAILKASQNTLAKSEIVVIQPSGSKLTVKTSQEYEKKIITIKGLVEIIGSFKI